MEILEQQRGPRLHHHHHHDHHQLPTSSSSSLGATTATGLVVGGHPRQPTSDSRRLVNDGAPAGTPAPPPGPPSLPRSSDVLLGNLESQDLMSTTGGGGGGRGEFVSSTAPPPSHAPPEQLPQPQLAQKPTMPAATHATVGSGSAAAAALKRSATLPPPAEPTTTTPALCSICKRPEEEGRPLLHFVPVRHDASVMSSAPTVRTFTEHVHLHVFCGKTASILPHVNQPDLEILGKAGLKNKHGTGPEVNAALARTRSAVVANPPSHTAIANAKDFYLVREFEAHLAAVRGTNIGLLGLLPVASADPYGSWRGPHQQYLLEQQRLEQQKQQEQQQQEQEVDADSASQEKQPPQGPGDLGAQADNGDLLLGLPNLDDPTLAVGSSSSMHHFPQSDSAPHNGLADNSDDVNLEGDGRQAPSPAATLLTSTPSGLFHQDSAVSTDAASLSAASDAASSNDKKRSPSSPTSAYEAEYKIPRKRLGGSTSSNSTPSRDATPLQTSPSLPAPGASNFIDHPSYAFSTGPSYRNGGSTLYHSMLMSSAASALDSSLMPPGSGNGTAGAGAVAPWSQMAVYGAPGAPHMYLSPAIPRVRCGCGGSHLPPDTSKGMLSWKNHYMTKRHQNWLRTREFVGPM